MIRLCLYLLVGPQNIGPLVKPSALFYIATPLWAAIASCLYQQTVRPSWDAALQSGNAEPNLARPSDADRPHTSDDGSSPLGRYEGILDIQPA